MTEDFALKTGFNPIMYLMECGRDPAGDISRHIDKKIKAIVYTQNVKDEYNDERRR